MKLCFLGQAFQFDSEIIIESGQFFNTAFNSTSSMRLLA